MSLPLTRRLSRSPLGRPAGTQTRGALRYFALRVCALYAGVMCQEDNMEYSPLLEVQDQILVITQSTLSELKSFKDSELFAELPGSVPNEKQLLTKLLDSILDTIINGLLQNPSKLWVMETFFPVLEIMQMQDTEAKEHFGDHLEIIMDILNIESSDGLLSYYL